MLDSWNETKTELRLTGRRLSWTIHLFSTSSFRGNSKLLTSEWKHKSQIRSYPMAASLVSTELTSKAFASPTIREKKTTMTMYLPLQVQGRNQIAAQSRQLMFRSCEKGAHCNRYVCSCGERRGGPSQVTSSNEGAPCLLPTSPSLFLFPFRQTCSGADVLVCTKLLLGHTNVESHDGMWL